MPGHTPIFSPFDKRAQYQNRRMTLLSEAARLFNSQGSGATTLKQVAATLDLTKTSLYYYVKTKLDLIYQCYSESCDYDFQLLEDCAALNAPGVAKVRQYILGSLLRWREIQAGRHPHVAILDSNDALPDAMREDIASRYQHNFNALTAIISGGIKDGSIAPCDPIYLAVAINGAVTWMPRWLSTLAETEIEAAARQTCELFLFGLASADGNYQFQALEFADSAMATPGSFDRSAQQQRKLDAFLNAGTQMFNSQGYDHTSLDAIAEMLGVTKGAFYYHIKSKPDLLRRCVEHTFELLEMLYTENNRSAGTGAQILERYCRHIFFIQNSAQGPLIRYNVMTRLPADEWQSMQPRVESIVAKLNRCVDDGIADGSLQSIDPDVFRRVIMGTTLSCLNISHWSQRSDSLAIQSRDYFSWLFNGLSAR